MVQRGPSSQPLTESSPQQSEQAPASSSAFPRQRRYQRVDRVVLEASEAEGRSALRTAEQDAYANYILPHYWLLRSYHHQTPPRADPRSRREQSAARSSHSLGNHPAAAHGTVAAGKSQREANSTTKRNNDSHEKQQIRRGRSLSPSWNASSPITESNTNDCTYLSSHCLHHGDHHHHYRDPASPSSYGAVRAPSAASLSPATAQTPVRRPAGAGGAHATYPHPFTPLGREVHRTGEGGRTASSHSTSAALSRWAHSGAFTMEEEEEVGGQRRSFSHTVDGCAGIPSRRRCGAGGAAAVVRVGILSWLAAEEAVGRADVRAAETYEWSCVAAGAREARAALRRTESLA